MEFKTEKSSEKEMRIVVMLEKALCISEPAKVAHTHNEAVAKKQQTTGTKTQWSETRREQRDGFYI